MPEGIETSKIRQFPEYHFSQRYTIKNGQNNFVSFFFLFIQLFYTFANNTLFSVLMENKIPTPVKKQNSIAVFITVLHIFLDRHFCKEKNKNSSQSIKK